MLEPNDEKLYRAVINLQMDENFKVVRAYLARRHSEEAGRFHLIKEDISLRQCQGKADTYIDLYLKRLNPTFAFGELENLEKKARENQSGKAFK